MIARLPRCFPPEPVVEPAPSDCGAYVLHFRVRTLDCDFAPRRRSHTPVARSQQTSFRFDVRTRDLDVCSELFQLYTEWFEQFGGETSFLAKEAEKELLRTDVA